jgi:hypothetical protein
MSRCPLTSDGRSTTHVFRTAGDPDAYLSAMAQRVSDVGLEGLYPWCSAVVTRTGRTPTPVSRIASS